MKLKENEIKILQILLSSNNYISTYEIATLTGITRRSVRVEISNVKNILNEYHISLDSKPNKGYLIKEKTPEMIHTLQILIDENENVLDAVLPDLPEDRANYILKTLAQTDKYIKLDDIADQLLVSRATIANDLITVKKHLSHFNLSIMQKPNYGIKLIGEESERRKALADTIFRDMNEREIYYDFLDTYLDSSDYKIIEIIRNNNIHLSDLSLVDILINYSISIARNMAGHPLDTVFEDFELIQNTNEYKAALQLSQLAKECYNVTLNESEILFFTIMMICKASTQNKIYYEDSVTSKLTHEILDDIYKSTLIHIDSKYYERLSLYIQTSLLRQKYQEKIRNPLFDKIQDDMPFALYLTRIVSKKIKDYTNIPLSRSEITAFTIFFNNIITEHTDHRKKALLINCMGNFASNYNINMLEKELLNDLVVHKCISYSELPNENIKDYDLIISNAPIHKSYDIPIINTSYIMTMDDIIFIKSKLTYYFNEENLVYYFHPELFEHSVSAKTKKGISTVLYQTLCKIYPLMKSSVKANFTNKNKYSLHSFNNNIGLLKLNTPINPNNNNIILTFKEPVSYDEQEFQILIVFSSYDQNNIMYDTLYNTLKKISEDNTVVESLTNSESYTEFLSILINNSINQKESHSVTPSKISKP